MIRFRFRTFAALAAMAATATACKKDSDDSGDDVCSSEIDEDYESPSTGTVTLHGSFPQGESVTLQYEDDSHTIRMFHPSSYSPDRKSATFTGMPSGTHGFDVIATCDEALSGEYRGPKSLTIK